MKLNRSAVAVVALVLVGVWFWGRSPAPSSQAMVYSPDELARKNPAERIAIDALKWDRSGFGNVAVASFSIANSNKFSVKDVQVRCKFFAKSGTNIELKDKVVFLTVPAGGRVLVANLNIGFVDQQVDSGQCAATGASIL